MSGSFDFISDAGFGKRRVWNCFGYDAEDFTGKCDPTVKALFEKYRQVRMPNVRIGDEDIAELIDFLKKQSKAPDGPVAAGKNEAQKSATGSSSVSLNIASHH